MTTDSHPSNRKLTIFLNFFCFIYLGFLAYSFKSRELLFAVIPLDFLISAAMKRIAGSKNYRIFLLLILLCIISVLLAAYLYCLENLSL